MDPLSCLSQVTRTWFARTFAAPSPPQAIGWPAIARGEHALLLAPTGSGKTLAAFLAAIDRLVRDLAEGRALDGVQILYVSPLKALTHDVHRNLEEPLAGVRAVAAELGLAPPEVTLALRTGDTAPAERARLARRPPHILCTTPESLYLLLTSRARETLGGVRWVIVDEIHALAGTKRGSHLALSLERLERQVIAAGGRAPVRIGLSATQRPLETIAAFLGGVDRPVTVLDAGMRKSLDLGVECPVDDLKALPEASIWPALVPRLAEAIRAHRTTLVFVNDRRGAERLCAQLNEALGGERVRAHHGALSRETRFAVEEALKAGQLPALVCTSSLELGIDIGSVDLVVQVGSPGGVARGLQRVGRAGHVLGAEAKGRLVARHRAELLECAALVPAMGEAAVERTEVPARPLDVLAQQVVAACAEGPWRVEELLATFRRAWPYRDLSRGELEAVLEMLTGRFPDQLQGELSPRLTWDQVNGVVRARAGALRVAVTSGGTIPDRGLYPVELGEGGPRLGELDEEFVYESRVGDVFQLGTSTWRIENIGLHKVTVQPAPGEPPRLPFWRGEGLGRSADLGERIGRLCRRYEEAPAGLEWLATEHLLDGRGVANLAAFLAEQRQAAGLPTDRRIVVEHYLDELGDARVAIHCPLGRRVLHPLALLLERRVTETRGVMPPLSVSDDGLLLRLDGNDEGLPQNPFALLAGVDAERLLVESVALTTLFGARFRDNAARALVLPRRGPGRRTPLYLQRLRAKDLLERAQRHPDFPVLVETYRECLRDVWDLARLSRLLDEIAAGQVEVTVVESNLPSPFARALQLGFTASFLYGDDLPRAERRAQLLPGGQLLGALLGGEELELLDPGVLADEEARAGRTDPRLRARDADELHDRLRALGPLDAAQVSLRVTGDGAAWLAGLARAGRVVETDGRFLAAEDVPRLAAARAGDEEALAQLVRRALAAAGVPRRIDELAAAASVTREEARRGLDALGAQVVALQGEDGEPHHVEADTLERLRRRSLAAARRAVRPVGPERYAAFVLRWQGLAPGDRHDAAGLDRALEGLAGFALPMDLAEREVLGRRLRRPDPAALDRALADGAWTFRCDGGAGGRTPRVTFWPRAELGPPGPTAPSSEAEARVLAHLQNRGASFFTDLFTATELDAGALGDALWALCLAGAVTNDRFEVVRRGRPAVGPERLASFRAARPSRVTPRLASGRWSLAGTPPEEARGWALRLLDRYGVVSREAVVWEDPPVPYGALVEVWKELELRGEVRRGYFVEGLAGYQVAWPQAVELLRAEAPPATVALSACDPGAAPFAGAASRLSSNFLVVDRGRAVLVLELGGRRLRLVGAREPEVLERAFTELGTLSGALELEEIDGGPALDSPFAERLCAAGFERDGARLRRSPLRRRALVE